MAKARAEEQLGMLLGFIAVTAFSLTLPITRYLTHYLNSWEIGLGRTVVAASAAIIVLLVMRQTWPTSAQLKRLLVTASGISFGFPVLTAIGMQTVPASHGGIVLGTLPLATALIGTFLSGERPSMKFWLVSLAGFIIVAVFSFIAHDGVGLALYQGDLALLGAVVMAGLGYAQGGQLAKTMGGWQVICWTLSVSLPLLLIPTYLVTDFNHFSGLPPMGWGAFLFLALVNSLIGFFFWYRGLAIGGIARVSQTQLLQPFLTFFFSVVFLGEFFNWTALLFTALIVATIIVSKRTPIVEKDSTSIAPVPSEAHTRS
jgi:drug/metabolite transporter (DMT)-like permease